MYCCQIVKIFDLPISTEINKAIPKNSFDTYVSYKQRKQFSELIDRIKWANKLSKQTINLNGSDIHEIQIFEITLKCKTYADEVLDAIDKAIPYPIIFISSYEDEYFVRLAFKHPNPANENISVLDWTYKSAWLNGADQPFVLNLKYSLDRVVNDFAIQLSGKKFTKRVSSTQLVETEQKICAIEKAIFQLKKAIKKEVQFNKKVEMNTELHELNAKLKRITDKFTY
ncbi:hypothetical protein CAP35_02120 [Chitinophagaceae bacterium IBVUCB1]|nr:hypothetical protein CAP35_02120 [Chitinophagaceae bacterium IBVUCB1]